MEQYNMTETSVDLKEDLRTVIEERFNCCDISQLIEFFVESGLISKKRLQYYMIKYEYYQELKVGADSCTSIKYDLAAKYDIEFNDVKNIIYKYKYIQA